MWHNTKINLLDPTATLSNKLFCSCSANIEVIATVDVMNTFGSQTKICWQKGHVQQLQVAVGPTVKRGIPPRISGCAFCLTKDFAAIIMYSK